MGRPPARRCAARGGRTRRPASRSWRWRAGPTTPLRWFRWVLRRASWLISATISFMKGRHGDRDAGRRQLGLGLHDLDLGHGLEGVVRADLRAEAVLERGDDAAAVRVVLGVGRGDEHDVEGQADAVAPDLDVALLEDVEQADLDALGEVGQLVDGEDAAVDARDEAVVQRQLVAEVAAFGDLDRVDLADEVRDGGVGRRQLLAVALRAVDPGDRRGLTELVDAVEREARDRGVGVVVDLGALDDGHPLVEEADEGADARASSPGPARPGG